MATSRPSRVGDPIPRIQPESDGLAEERAEVDRKLVQLEKARERAAAARIERQEEANRREGDRLKKDLGLSRRQDLLLRAVAGKAPRLQEAVEAVYGVRWARLTTKNRRRYLSRLQTLQHALNQKLRDKNYPWRVSANRGQLDRVDEKRWKKRREDKRAPKAAARRPRGGVDRWPEAARCAARLRLFLKGGWRPVVYLQANAREAGFSPSAFKAACKRLGLQRRRIGFGSNGQWQVRLPTKPKKRLRALPFD